MEAFRKTLARAETADEMLGVLADAVVFVKDSTMAPFPFGFAAFVEVDDCWRWQRDLLRALIEAAPQRRRGRSRVMRTPQPPPTGTMFHGPDQGLITVLCATQSGIVYCVRLVEGRWAYEELVGYAAEDFPTFRPYGAPDPTPADGTATEPVTTEDPSPEQVQQPADGDRAAR